MYFKQLVKEDLGCASYIVGCTNAGVCAVAGGFVPASAPGIGSGAAGPVPLSPLSPPLPLVPLSPAPRLKG